mgnify:FL=1
MTELIVQGCVEIKIAVHGLRDMKNLREMTEALIKINSIENQADDIFDMSIEMLFNNENDFKEVNIILSPVTPGTPPKIGESLKDPHAMYLSDAYTVGFSLGQLPTLTIPQGTETGLQITAAKNNDELVLKFANFLKDTI